MCAFACLAMGAVCTSCAFAGKILFSLQSAQRSLCHLRSERRMLSKRSEVTTVALASSRSSCEYLCMHTFRASFVFEQCVRCRAVNIVSLHLSCVLFCCFHVSFVLEHHAASYYLLAVLHVTFRFVAVAFIALLAICGEIVTFFPLRKLGFFFVRKSGIYWNFNINALLIVVEPNIAIKFLKTLTVCICKCGRSYHCANYIFFF